MKRVIIVIAAVTLFLLVSFRLVFPPGRYQMVAMSGELHRFDTTTGRFAPLWEPRP